MPEVPDSLRSGQPSVPSDEPVLAARIARGTMAQQGGLGVVVASGLVVTTALARGLSLAEFGVYGFVVAIASYFAFVIGTAETAAVNEMASATGRHELDLAFTRSILVYAVLGLGAGVLVAAGGALLVSFIDISPELTQQARLGAVALGFLTAGGWTAKVFQDYLRATHRFTAASTSEALGSLLLCGLVLLALSLDAPLWCLIAAGGATTFYVGVCATITVAVRGIGCSFRPREVRAADLRSFVGYSGRLLFISSSDLVINSLDRTIVGVLRSASTLGLYEAASKLNNLARLWVGNLGITLIPVLSHLRAVNDEERQRDTLVLGTRYMLVAAVGPTVTLMVLSDRVLAVWLGDRYTAAAPAATVFLAMSLISPNLAVANNMLVVSRELRHLTIFSWAVAGVNLALSIVLTAWLGLVGVAIGTTGGYLLMTPYFASFAFKGRGVTVGEFARRVWIPAYGTGLLLAAILLGVRLAVPLDHLWSVLAVAGVAVAGYWAFFYFFLTRPDERDLVRVVAGRPSKLS